MASKANAKFAQPSLLDVNKDVPPFRSVQFRQKDLNDLAIRCFEGGEE